MFTLDASLATAMVRFERYCLNNSQSFLRSSRNTACSLRPGEAFDLPVSETVTVFHTRTHMAMPLAQLAERLARRIAHVDDGLLGAALVLCARYASAAPPVTWHMLHRLYVAALHVAMKAHNDYFLSLSAFAAAAGVTAAEMPRMERALVKGVGYRCVVLVHPEAQKRHASPLAAAMAAVEAEIQFAWSPADEADDFSDASSSSSFDAAVGPDSSTEATGSPTTSTPPAGSPVSPTSASATAKALSR